MAKQDQILDENFGKQKKETPKSSLRSDLVDILIGILVMVGFIGALVFAIGALLK